MYTKVKKYSLLVILVFKGSWLTTWLLDLGAEVCGISKDIPTQPSMFEELGLEGDIEHHIADVRNLETIRSIILNFKPDFLFHLAAQLLFPSLILIL